jgi:tetratricopeptide (TPR) repeat protein
VSTLSGEPRESWHQDRAAVRDLVEQIMALDESAARCPPGNNLDRPMMGLRFWALLFLNYLGDSAAQASVIGEQLLADQERLLGLDHPDTLYSRNNLANAYQEAGRTGKAISLLDQTLAARERVLGPDHPSTLQSRNNLALAYQEAGRTEEAISLQEQTLTARERIQGPDHPSTLNSRDNLATAYRALREHRRIMRNEPTLLDPWEWAHRPGPSVTSRGLGRNPRVVHVRRAPARAREAAWETEGQAVSTRLSPQVARRRLVSFLVSYMFVYLRPSPSITPL